jgi:hypothetical protein
MLTGLERERERRMKRKRNFFSQLVITYYPSNENALAHVDSNRSGVKKKRDNLVSGSFVLFHYDAPAGF